VEADIETYIVRILRDEEGDPPVLVGDVEIAGIEGRRPFHSREELWRLLRRTQAAGGRARHEPGPGWEGTK
jgi:hypothetical protein